MKVKYKNIDKSEFIICIAKPKGVGSDSFPFTKGKRYKILEYINGFQINIIDDVGQIKKFNLYAPFGEYFCTLSYLRAKKLKKLEKNVLKNE